MEVHDDKSIGVEAARSVTRFLYRLAGLEAELDCFPFPEAFHETQSVHIHIPKTGGNSAREMLYGAASVRLGGHIPALRFRDASPTLYQRYFVFATVRHPLSRLSSAFRYLRHGGMTASDRIWAQKTLRRYAGFTEFITSMLDKVVRDRIMRCVHFWPQTHFICDAEGNLIVDYLVRMENFENDLRHVCGRLRKPVLRVPIKRLRRIVEPGAW